MISIVELEKHMIGASIHSIIINKLYHKKKSYPIILFKVDKGSKVSFYCIILPLSLAVRL